MGERRYHSVRLDKSQCRGCTNCLKHCPTEAIRVRGGRAHIIDERCIDCGECIRICEFHAKIAVTDPLSVLDRFKYTIALPAPSLYSQFKHVKNRAVILEALKKIGFTDVFEVARGADIATRAIRDRLEKPDAPRPLISSACPTVVRLIQVRFPSLIDNIVDVRQPMEIAGMVAKDEFCKKHGCDPEDVGCFFITPCPAKMTAIHNPIGHKTSAFAGAISILDIYGKLRSYVNEQMMEEPDNDTTPLGVGWGTSSGEAMAVCPGNSLCVDGIQNVSRVLEEIENDKLSDLVYFEGNACMGGCVGGPLMFENNYVAKTSLRKLVDAMPKSDPADRVSRSLMQRYPLYTDQEIEPNSAMQLDENIAVAIQKMDRMNEILDRLPGYDCGSCGSPTCRTFAEDIVRGYCGELDCIHILKERIRTMAQQMVELAQTKRE